MPGRLKKMRESLKPKPSQEKFAQKFGVGRSTYSGYETGTSEPDLKTLIEIADYFGVSLDYLVGRTDNPQMYLISNDMEKEIIDLSDENNLKKVKIIVDEIELNLNEKLIFADLAKKVFSARRSIQGTH